MPGRENRLTRQRRFRSAAWLVLIVGLAVSAWIFRTAEDDTSDVIGYVGLSLITALSQMVVATAITILHAVETRRNTGIGGMHALRLIGAPLLLCLTVGAGVITVSGFYVISLWHFLVHMGIVG